MEAYKSDSDDEVFVGEVTEREINRATFNSRRRTTVYFPGISRPDSCVSFYKEHTEDGTLIFSFENIEESGKHNTVNRSNHGPESSTSELSSSETGSEKLSKRDGNKRSNSQASLSEGSDMDSGFGSLNDGCSMTSPASLTYEPDAERCIQKADTKLDKAKESPTRERKSKRGHRSSENGTVPLQSPLLSVKAQPVNPVPHCTPVNRKTYCRETSSADSRAAHRAAAAFSELRIESSKQELSSGPHSSSVVKDFPMYPSDSGCMSPATNMDGKVLPLKRKIAQRSPSVELKPSVIKDTERRAGANHIRTKKGNSFHVLSPADCDDGLGHSFDIFYASRKLQKLDISCDESPEVREKSRVSKADRTLSAGGDAHVTPQFWSVSPHVFVPETPDIRSSAFQSSHKNLPSQSSPDCFVQTGYDELDTIPSSQRSLMDVSPVAVPSSQTTEMDISQMSRGDSILAKVKPEGKLLNITDGSRREPAPALSASKHYHQMDLTTPDSPDLFSSPPSSSSGTGTQGPVHSPMPASTITSTSKQKPSLQSVLQPIQENQSMGSKYGNLVWRKPMILKRGNKENIEKEPLPGQQHALPSFQRINDTLLEDSRAAMTRINTIINGETRHILRDPKSSPALMTHFPAPKQASRISWSERLGEEAASSQFPISSPEAPRRSILQQRPDNFEFPFSKEPPSPIVLTRRRLPKLPRLSFDN